MALVKCLECGKEISDKAQACPGCGAPITPAIVLPAENAAQETTTVHITRTGGRWEGIGFLLITVGLVSALAGVGGFSIALMMIGFVVFIIGRFK